jgi:hypothetical protein
MKPERYQNLQKILNIVEPAHSGGNDRFCARLKTDISAPFQGGPGGGGFGIHKKYLLLLSALSLITCESSSITLLAFCPKIDSFSLSFFGSILFLGLLTDFKFIAKLATLSRINL